MFSSWVKHRRPGKTNCRVQLFFRSVKRRSAGFPGPVERLEDVKHPWFTVDQAFPNRNSLVKRPEESEFAGRKANVNRPLLKQTALILICLLVIAVLYHFQSHHEMNSHCIYRPNSGCRTSNK